ncbi:hypothetical protein GMA84_07320, partial [Turicibacter sanguinis]|nr:hypothetical protein [Turicibacter sanguinis]
LYTVLRKKVIINYYLILKFCFCCLLMFSLFYTPQYYVGYAVCYKSLTLLVITFCIINYLDRLEKIKYIIYSFVIGGGVLCIHFLNIYGLKIFEDTINSKYGLRVGGELGNENTIALFCGYSIIISAYILFYKNPKILIKIICLLSGISCFILSMMTASKKALILIFFGLGILFILKRYKKNIIMKKILSIIISVGLLVFIYQIIKNVDLFWYINLRIEEFIQTLNSNGGIASESDQVRLDFIKSGFNIFLKKPILGNGVASSYYYFNTYSHNNYIEILMNNGILGFILYYSTYIITLLKLTKLKYNYFKFSVLCYIFISSLFILEFGLVDYYERYYQIFFAIISVFITLQFNDLKKQGAKK